MMSVVFKERLEPVNTGFKFEILIISIMLHRKHTISNSMQLSTNPESLIVIDNFYQDPHAVRQMAMNSEYHPPSMVGEIQQNFSGRLSLQNYHPNGLSQYVSRLLGKHVRAIPKIRHGYFRYELPGDLPYTTLIHNDEERDDQGRVAIHYSLVVYLTESAPDPNKNGTLFFRHKKLQCNRVSDESASLLSIEDMDKLEQWDVDSVVSFSWNKAVLFDSTLFHAPGAGFGTNKEDARCVQVFYFCNFDS